MNLRREKIEQREKKREAVEDRSKKKRQRGEKRNIERKSKVWEQKIY